MNPLLSRGIRKQQEMETNKHGMTIKLNWIGLIDSNLRQKSGNVLKRESAREFFGDDAGDLLLDGEGRGDWRRWRATNERKICEKK